jgi:predicted metal-dependent peptidase
VARKKAQRAATEDPALIAFQRGCSMVAGHPLFAPLYAHAWLVRRPDNVCPADGWAVVTSGGQIHAHPTRRGEPEEWAFVVAHCLLHLGFDHFQERPQPLAWNLACDAVVDAFLMRLKLGRPPAGYVERDLGGGGDEEQRYRRLCERGVPPFYRGDLLLQATPDFHYGGRADWRGCLADGLRAAVNSAVEVAAGVTPSLGAARAYRTKAEDARAWFVSNYPLLGALASSFELIEDPLVCQRLGISVAAVDMETREIFINPAAGLSAEEHRFVMAHELLHVGLRHDVRCRGRDPFLWNVACDYVINGWLVEMGIGQLPRVGALYDQTLKHESAEAIYDMMVTDMRRFRKLATLRGVGASDILVRGAPDWWALGEGLTLDEFYRRCLSQGLLAHQAEGRGLLPADLIEEIQALYVPPIPWDVELARWFDHYFPLLEKVRSWARPSRRQSATPDIPRPSVAAPPNWEDGRTFGVILDTSGSMNYALLAKALGAIASYSVAREVPAARVVFCDAVAYDAGYMAPDAIAQRVQVRGRGGTMLQPGIDLLERAPDFPRDGPLLIITDGLCDRCVVRYPHAFLLPEGARLPFVPQGPVFRIR